MAERACFTNLGAVPKEMLPYYLLSPREREVLQHTANGETQAIIAKNLGISPKTVGAHKAAVGRIGMTYRGGCGDDGGLTKPVTLALIQDGIRNKYVSHDEENWKVVPVTRREDEVLNKLSQGFCSEQIAEQLFLSLKTVENHMGNIRRKLNTRTIYHTVARRTHFMEKGEWRVSSHTRKPKVVGA